MIFDYVHFQLDHIFNFKYYKHKIKTFCFMMDFRNLAIFSEMPENDQIALWKLFFAAMHVILFILFWYYWNLTQVLSMICYTCSKNLKAITTLSREISKDVSMMTLPRISPILVPFPYIFRRVLPKCRLWINYLF